MRTTATKQDVMIKGGSMTKKTAKSGSISRRRLLKTVSGRGACRFAVSHQSAGGAGSHIKIGFPQH